MCRPRQRNLERTLTPFGRLLRVHRGLRGTERRCEAVSTKRMRTLSRRPPVLRPRTAPDGRPLRPGVPAAASTLIPFSRGTYRATVVGRLSEGSSPESGSASRLAVSPSETNPAVSAAAGDGPRLGSSSQSRFAIDPIENRSEQIESRSQGARSQVGERTLHAQSAGKASRPGFSAFIGTRWLRVRTRMRLDRPITAGQTKRHVDHASRFPLSDGPSVAVTVADAPDY